MKLVIFFILIAVFIPAGHVFASIFINEIAWMGTIPKEGESLQAAANNEWIELYNSSGAAMVLDGWQIIAEDGSPDIILSGSISSGGYFLLERSSDEVLLGINADLVYPYKNALSNGGERLFLKDALGVVRDEVNASGGWPAGDNSTKDTMQKSGNSWITASPTPRAVNVGESFSPSPPVQESPPSSSTIPASSQPVLSVLEEGGSLSIKAYAGEDRAIVAGSVTEFFGSAVGLGGEPLTNARFFWNFGDGETKDGRVVSHTFKIPGKYIVGLHVSSGEYAGSDYLTVDVIPNQITISGVLIGERGYVKLFNPTARDIQIGGWLLEDSMDKRFYLPLKTLIGAKTEIALANDVTGLLKDTSALPLVLRYPNLTLAGEWNASPVVPEKSAGSEKVAASRVAPAEDLRSKPDDVVRPGPVVYTAIDEEPMDEFQGADRAKKLAASAGFVGGSVFFAISLILGLAAAAGFLIIRVSVLKK